VHLVSDIVDEDLLNVLTPTLRVPIPVPDDTTNFIEAPEFPDPVDPAPVDPVPVDPPNFLLVLPCLKMLLVIQCPLLLPPLN
jgi:hypothetical protein